MAHGIAINTQKIYIAFKFNKVQHTRENPIDPSNKSNLGFKIFEKLFLAIFCIIFNFFLIVEH